MTSTSRLTYNINSLNNSLDINNKYDTYGNNLKHENINNDIIYQSQNINQNENQNISVNKTNSLIHYQTYSNDNNNYNNTSYDLYNDNRFILLHSRLDEINDTINKNKMEKENFIHSKISTTENILDNNNENSSRKIKEIKCSIRKLSLLFEEIKKYSKEINVQTDEILGNFENKFNLRMKEEQEKRKNLEKRLKNMIDSKFKEMKYKLYDNSKERFNKLEEIKNKIDSQIPQLGEIVDDEKKQEN